MKRAFFLTFFIQFFFFFKLTFESDIFDLIELTLEAVFSLRFPSCFTVVKPK